MSYPLKDSDNEVLNFNPAQPHASAPPRLPPDSARRAGKVPPTIPPHPPPPPRAEENLRKIAPQDMPASWSLLMEWFLFWWCKFTVITFKTCQVSSCHI